MPFSKKIEWLREKLEREYEEKLALEKKKNAQAWVRGGC